MRTQFESEPLDPEQYVFSLLACINCKPMAPSSCICLIRLFFFLAENSEYAYHEDSHIRPTFPITARKSLKKYLRKRQVPRGSTGVEDASRVIKSPPRSHTCGAHHVPMSVFFVLFLGRVRNRKGKLYRNYANPLT